ncbi:1168_t:CDS:2 [Dentiscutata erythropus]|uniref:1168_t:CDS:1 n=1 Tax=Dentiscutata erythropus TaxID=1348616 RepID=A0A9N9H5N5_9GLOM|nr:1168_t:CDS:2 [Dentiscutata erythropus]
MENGDDFKFILSIDGGGFRGIIPAAILTEIERRVTEEISKEHKDVDIRCADLFDIISGTSTGSILALGLSTPDKNKRPKFDAKYILDFYKNNGHNVFSNYPALKLKNHIEQESEEIKAEIREKGEEVSLLSRAFSFRSYTFKSFGFGSFRNKTQSNGVDVQVNKSGFTGSVTTSKTEITKEDHLDKVLTTIMGYAADINLIKPRYDGIMFDNLLQQEFESAQLKDTNTYDDYLMRDVCRASAAAPAFFPAKQMGEQYFIDGGVFLNNPTAVAYLKAKKLYPNSKFVVISIGTGYYKNSLQKYSDAGALQWGIPLLNLLFNAELNSNDANMKMMADLDGSKYFRLQKLMDADTSFDTVSDKEIDILDTMAKDIIDDPNNHFDEIIKLLVEKCRKNNIFPRIFIYGITFLTGISLDVSFSGVTGMSPEVSLSAFNASRVAGAGGVATGAML